LGRFNTEDNLKLSVRYLIDAADNLISQYEEGKRKR